MKNEYRTYRKEAVRHRKYFFSVLKLCLIGLLVISCKKNSSGPEIDTNDLLPSALILSPPKVTVANSQGTPDAIKNAKLLSDVPERKSGIKALAGPSEPDKGDDWDESDADISREKTTDLPDATYLKDTPILFEGVGINFEGDTLDGSSLKWFSDIDGELGTGNLLEKNDLDSGRHWISLIVTDNNQLESRDSVRIHIINAEDLIDGLDGPVAEITSLTDGLSLLKNAGLILEGTGLDPEEGELTGAALSWSSDTDGDLGTGSSLDVTGDLSLGNHTIVLTATNSNGDTATDSVSISIGLKELVNELPVAEILSLTNGSTLLDGVKLVLEGTGIDPEDGELTGPALSWESDMNGVLGEGRSLDVTGLLSLGDHIITLTVTDSKGATNSDSVNISIGLEEVINELPVVEIISVAEITSLGDVLTLLENVKLILKATGLDAEDGELPGSAFSWKSDVDGKLGEGRIIDVTGMLSLGDHTITVTATDNEGATATDSIEITLEKVINELPVAEILSLTNGSTLLDGLKLILEGTGIDPEDGELTGSALSWESDVDGELGEGHSLDVTGRLSLGNHTITLTATDSEGATDIDSVEILLEEIINESPVAEITSLANGLVIPVLGDLILEGTGQDPEDGELDGSSLSWSSNLEGDLGTGNLLDVTGQLSLGDHTITLTAIDSDGETDTDYIEFTIFDESPVARITSVTDESNILNGLKLILKGSGIDPEDGELFGNNLVWSTIHDGELIKLGTGNSLTITEDLLSLNKYTITLTVTDSEGNTDNDSVEVNLLDFL